MSTPRFSRETGELYAKEIRHVSQSLYLGTPSGETAEPSPSDTLIYEDGFSSQNADEAALLRVAADLPYVLKVRRDCAACGMDIMTLVRVGDDQRTYYTCTCGFKERVARD